MKLTYIQQDGSPPAGAESNTPGWIDLGVWWASAGSRTAARRIWIGCNLGLTVEPICFDFRHLKISVCFITHGGCII